MKNNKVKSKVMVYNLITIVLATVFVILLCSLLYNILNGRRMADPMFDVRFWVQRSSYNQLYSSVETYKKRDYEGNKEYKKYEAISDYYINSIKYNMYEQYDSKKAKECREKMSEDKALMKDLDFAADEIDNLFTGYLNKIEKDSDE